MKIKWRNVLIVITLLLSIVLLPKVIKNMKTFNPQFHLPDYIHDPIYGLMFLGLICITIVVITNNMMKK